MLILQLMKSSVFKYFTITSIFLISCSVKNDDVLIPENILSKEETIKIITDCYLAEGASGINVKAVNGQSIDFRTSCSGSTCGTFLKDLESKPHWIKSL